MRIASPVRPLPHPPAGPAVVWEETDCPSCGHARWSPVIEGPDPLPGNGGLWFAVVRCAACGLCYTNPRPDARSIGHFYPADYRPFHAKGRPPAGLLGLLGGRCSERRMLPWHGRGRLLDFGCGGGSFLARMAAQGWHVAGLDVSPAAVEAVRGGLGLPAFAGSLPHPDLVPGSFDVVTMWHSLEHVHSPLATARAARDLLAPGGRLYVAVPNIASLPFRWFGRDWFALDLPRHLTHFAPETLRGLLTRAGFVVRELKQVRHVDWLRSSARLAADNGRAGITGRLLGLRPVARLLARLCELTGRSDAIVALAERTD